MPEVLKAWLAGSGQMTHAATVALGALGGALFHLFNLPLPWMLGAMTATLIAAMANAPLEAPDHLRPTVVAVIGVMLGSGFHSDAFSQLSQWIASLSALLGCIVVQACAVSIYYRRIGRMDPVTALFAAMPGGLVEMMEVGRQHGGDERAIILSHAVRLVLVITLVAFWFRIIVGYEVSGMAPMGRGVTGVKDLAILAACGLIGAFGGRMLRLPAPTFVGPLLCSSCAHIAGWTAGSPPVWLVIMAQIVLGAIVGSRFIGVSIREIARAFALGLGATIIMLALTMGFALVLAAPLGQSTEQILLAFAPGGLTEMSLVSLAMGADVAYIATHHLVRVVTLLAVAGTVLAAIARRMMSQ